eukprot:356232-Chlamydomonas_euryale.AAC.33
MRAVLLERRRLRAATVEEFDLSVRVSMCRAPCATAFPHKHPSAWTAPGPRTRWTYSCPPSRPDSAGSCACVTHLG